MNNMRITRFLDELLDKYEQTPSLLEQKEELASHLTERVQDHMAKGLSYDEAFDATITDIGDVSALVAGIAPEKEDTNHTKSEKKKGKKKDKKKGRKKADLATMLTALSPFVYVLLGLVIGGWFWVWGWVIIPVTAILAHADGYREKIVSITPFVYVAIGLLGFWGWRWWAFGWIIIPVSAIVLFVGFND